MLYTSGVHSSYVMRIVLSCSEGSKGRQASAVNPEGLELYCDDDISLKERLQRAEVVSSLITLRCVCLQNLWRENFSSLSLVLPSPLLDLM